MDQAAAAATTTPWRMRFSQMEPEPPPAALSRWQQRPAGPWQIGLSQLQEAPEPAGPAAVDEVSEPGESAAALVFPPQVGRGMAPSVQPFFIRGGVGSPPHHPSPSTASRVQPTYIRGGLPDCSGLLNPHQLQQQRGAPEAAAPMAWAIHGDSCSQAQHAPAAVTRGGAATWALHGSGASEEDVQLCSTSGRAAGPNLGQQPLAWSLRGNCHPPADAPRRGDMVSDTVIGIGRALESSSHVMADDSIDPIGDAMDVDGPLLRPPLCALLLPFPQPRSQREQSPRWPLPQAYAQPHPDVSARSLPLAAAMPLSGPGGLPHPLSTVTASALPAAAATVHPPWATWSIAEQTLAAASVALPAWSAGDIPPVPVCGERAQIQEQVLPLFEGGGLSVQALVDQLAAAQREAQRGQWPPPHPPQFTPNAAVSPLPLPLQPRCLYMDLDLDMQAQGSANPRSPSASGPPPDGGLSVEELIKRLGIQQQEQQREQQREQQQRQQQQREQQEGQEGSQQLDEQLQKQRLDDHRQPAETSQQGPGWGLHLGSHLPASRVFQEQPSQQASCLGLMGSQHHPRLRTSADVGGHCAFTLTATVVGVMDTAGGSASSPPRSICEARQQQARAPGGRDHLVQEELSQQQQRPAAGLDQSATVGNLDLDPDLGAAACWDLLSSSSSLRQASPGPSFALLPEAAALVAGHDLSGRSKLITDTVIH